MKYFTKKMTTPLSTTAELTGYVPDNSPEIDPKRKRPAVIICPGGAYRMTSDREAEAVAFKFLGMDLAAFVLRYSCAPARYPVALLELAESVRYVRAHAKELDLDPDKIIILGMSAGGHLAASLGTLWTNELFTDHGYEKDMIKPNGMILCYPVITAGEFSHSGSFDNLVGEDQKLREFLSLEKRVTTATPPTFIWHTVADQSVPVENSLLFAQALRKHGIDFEMHLYPYGRHGLSLGTKQTAKKANYIEPAVQSWISLVETWLAGGNFQPK